MLVFYTGLAVQDKRFVCHTYQRAEENARVGLYTRNKENMIMNTPQRTYNTRKQYHFLGVCYTLLLPVITSKISPMIYDYFLVDFNNPKLLHGQNEIGLRCVQRCFKMWGACPPKVYWLQISSCLKESP